MGELWSGGEGQVRTQGVGTAGGVLGRPDTAPSVSEALEGDLDAYLDRELFVGPRAEPEALEVEPVTSVSGSMRALLDLAEAESEWLETQPAPSAFTASTAELKPEPVEPPVVIPEWMRVEPGTEAPVSPVVETAAHVLHESAVAGAPWGSAAGTDMSGMPMTPWSVPATPVPLPGSLPPPAAASAPALTGNLLPGLPPPPPAVPMSHYPSHPWGHPAVAPVEPRRIAGMRPGAFLGAAAVGALAAGLLVVAGLHLRDSGARGPMPGVSGTVAGTARPVGAGSEGHHPGTSPLTGAMADGSTTVATQPGATGTPVATQSGATGTQLLAGTVATSPDGVTGTAPAAQPGATGTPPAPGADLQGAAASLSGTVLSTARGDVRSAADSLRAPQPPEPAASGTTLTSGKASAAAVRESPARKVAAKPRAAPAPTTTTEDEAASDEESTASATGELTFDDSESESESGSADDSDTDAPGAKVAASSAQARPPDPYSELDEDFARELGFTEDAESKGEEDSRASRTVYIPPAPDAKEHLSPEDVKQVVVANQPAITACIRQHAQGTPVQGGGRFLMKWSVLPSGDTAQVSMDTDTLRATPLARCLEDVVRRWKFPAHRVRMEAPIRFPFDF